MTPDGTESSTLNEASRRKPAIIRSPPSGSRRPASFGGNSSRTAGHARSEPARSLAARLLRGLRPARQLHQHAQRLHHRSFAHGNAADGAKTLFAVQDAAIPRGDGEVHEADRL